MDRTFLGIDMGTSSIKLTLIDRQKNILSCASRSYEPDYPEPGWVQIDPEIWYEAMLEAMDEIFAQVPGSRLAAIGITGQMHTLVTLGENGESVYPAIMWNDTRSAGLIPELRNYAQSIPGGEHIAKIVSTGSPAAGLYWLRREKPEIFSGIRHFLIGPDYLVYRLTGVIGTDYCEASTSSLFRMDEMTWSQEMRTFIGADERIYPLVKGSCTRAGCVIADIAARYGFSADTAVITGTGDNIAAAISTGCMQEGYPVISLGTSGVLMIPADCYGELKKGKTILYSPYGRKFSCLVQGVVQSTGESVKWLTGKVFGNADLFELEKKVDPDRLSGSKLIFYPHLSGEKTLFADPLLRGAFFGLGSDTDMADLYGAVLEGICFAFRELTEKMGVSLKRYKSIKVVGGGSKSDLWLQLLADVMGMPTERFRDEAGAGIGVALMALDAALRGIVTENPAQKEEYTDRVFVPEPARRQMYDKKYGRYLRVRPALRYIESGNTE